MQGDLTPQIVFWVFKSPGGLQVFHFWEWELHSPTSPKVGLWHSSSCPHALIKSLANLIVLSLLIRPPPPNELLISLYVHHFHYTILFTMTKLNDINLQHVSFHNKTSKVLKYNHENSNIKLKGYVVKMDDAKIQ
jgi:hypothetical protein